MVKQYCWRNYLVLFVSNKSIKGATMFRIIAICLFILLLAGTLFYKKTLIRLYEGYQLTQQSKERAKYYYLADNEYTQDITQKIISDKSVPLDLKKPLTDGERRIIVFKYPSDSYFVAGYYSYLTKGYHPTMIFLRGGNGFFGIMRPNNKYSFLKNFNVVGTLYRGNIYGGSDQFGGDDVNDIENLFKFFPKLEVFTQTKIQPPFTMMGVSRGSMEMFNALSRSTYVRDKVNKAISVSGNLNLDVSMQKRPEMKYLFQSVSQKSEEKNLNRWLESRNPINKVKELSSSLRVLLLYGLADNRVDIKEQTTFKEELDKHSIDSKLVLIPEGDHGLSNKFEELESHVIKFGN